MSDCGVLCKRFLQYLKDGQFSCSYLLASAVNELEDDPRTNKRINARTHCHISGNGLARGRRRRHRQESLIVRRDRKVSAARAAGSGEVGAQWPSDNNSLFHGAGLMS